MIFDIYFIVVKIEIPHYIIINHFIVYYLKVQSFRKNGFLIDNFLDLEEIFEIFKRSIIINNFGMIKDIHYNSKIYHLIKNF